MPARGRRVAIVKEFCSMSASASRREPSTYEKMTLELTWARAELRMYKKRKWVYDVMGPS
jgi:hypothetical protein